MSPVVMALAVTAGTVVLLLVLLILLRCVRQQRRQATLRGGRKAKHTRLRGKEDETPSARADEASESGSDDEIIGDDKHIDAESGFPQGEGTAKSSPSLRAEPPTDEPPTDEPSTIAVIDEKELLARVESLLSDAPPQLAGHHRME